MGLYWFFAYLGLPPRLWVQVVGRAILYALKFVARRTIVW
jgi:hypothetical protein